jgi:uncharacterized protein (DUF4415 family)
MRNRIYGQDGSVCLPNLNVARVICACKEAISLRLDMDVLDWLRRKGPGYQTEINRILREKMLSET